MARRRWSHPLLLCVILGLASAEARSDDPPPSAAGDGPAEAPPEDPAAAARRKRAELDARREQLPEAARPAIGLLDRFREREIRVWGTVRHEIVALGAAAVPALLIGLEEDDWETRAFAASCLARIGDPAAAAAIADAYAAETYDEARRQYALALAEIGADSSKEVLASAATSGHAGVRVAAVRGLGLFEDQALAETLRGYVDDPDLDVRYEARGALAAVGDEAAVAGLLAEVEKLVEDRESRRVDSAVAMDNGDRYTQYLLGLALARATDPRADKVLVDALTAEKEYQNKDFLRMGAAEGLGRRAARGGDVHPKLVSGITHKDNRVRVAASYGAGWCRRPELVPKLVKALGDSQLDVRHNAVMALARIGNAEAADALRRSAGTDKAEEVRVGAVRGLTQIRLPEATKGLVAALGDDKYMLRVLAARGLQHRTAEPGVLEALLKATRDADYGVREQALASLAHHLDGAATLPAFVDALDDPDYGVRTNACLALAAIADTTPAAADATAARKMVSLYLGATERKLERGALEGLDAVRPPAAVPHLIDALGADQEEVRRRAKVALMTICETSKGFDPAAPKAERDAAQKRWREWWATQGDRLPRRGERPRAAVTGFADTARDLKWKGLDIALLFDSTGSMAGLIRAAKERVDEIVDQLQELLPSVRVSVYTYRDFGDNYVFYGTPLTYDVWKLSGFLQNATHGQGGDIPEAVYDTVKNVTENLKWRPDAHKVVVYAGDAPHHPEQDAGFEALIRSFFTVRNQAQLHALFTDTKRRSLDVKVRRQREDPESFNNAFFRTYRRTAELGRGRGVLLDDESALIKDLLVLTFGEAWRADIENLLDFER